MWTISISNSLQVGVIIDLENLLWLSFLTVSHFLECSPFSGHRFSTTLPFLCPKAINRKQNIAMWSKKSYLLPYQESSVFGDTKEDMGKVILECFILWC